VEKGKSGATEVCWEYGIDINMDDLLKDLGEIRIIFGMKWMVNLMFEILQRIWEGVVGSLLGLVSGFVAFFLYWSIYVWDGLGGLSVWNRYYRWYG